MNRKLINGLLLLTVATGGVGTFTSCKDNEDSFIEDSKKTQGELFKILDDKIKNGDENLAVVRDKLNALLDAGLLTEENQKYLEDLIKNSSTNLKQYVDDMVMNLITNVQIEEVYNPAFGTINLPLGIKNGLLCNYYYQSDHKVDNFPNLYDTEIVYGDKVAIADLEAANLTPKNDNFSVGTEIQPIKNLGEIYVTINPASIPETALKGLTVTMVKTNGETVLGTLEPVKEDNHVKNFGYTRSRVQNGFYKFVVSVDAANVPSINLNLDDNLKAAAKDFVNSPSKSDLLGLAEAIYKQFNNRIPALGLRFDVTVDQSFTYNGAPWSSAPGGLVLPNVTVDPTTGDYILNGNTPENSQNPIEDVTVGAGQTALRTIISPYDIAAVTYHPLTYAWLYDSEHTGDVITNRRLPQIGHIQEYVSRILDKVNFQLNLEGLDPAKYSIDLSGVEFKVDPTSMQISLAGLPVYDVKSDGTADKDNIVGVLGDDAVITLGYKQPNDPDAGFEYQPEALNKLIDSIVEAVNGKGKPDSFVAQIQSQVDSQLKKIIGDINDQLKSVNTQITDKIQSVKDEINNELNGRLGDGINRLIDLYNKVAEKVNSILDDPNAYMQVYAAYRDGNGDLHHLSTVASDPSIFTKGTGDAITLFLTSYNAELIAPAYKKYVAIVKDLDGGAITNANNASELNKVLDGRQQKAYIAVNDLTPGHTYQLVYTALDYRGNVSARSFYIKVAK